MELPELDRVMQFTFQRDTGRDVFLHLPVEEAQGVAPRFFGLIHGDVGLFHQFVCHILLAVEQGDPDAGRAAVCILVELVRLAQRCEDLLADGFRLGRGFNGLLTQVQ